MKDETIVKIVAITSLTMVCLLALSKGIDSFLTSSISAIIGGIAGYEIRRSRDRIEKPLRG